MNSTSIIFSVFLLLSLPVLTFSTEEYEFVLMWGEKGSGPGQFNGVGSIDVDSEGNVYVQDKNNYRIQKFTDDGEYLLEWGKYGNNDGEFLWLRGICVDNENNLFVDDSDPWDDDPCKIQKFDSQGNFILRFGQFGIGLGEFDLPTGMDIDKDNNLYICDKDNKRIQKFNIEGEFLSIWTDSTKFDPEGGPDNISFLPLLFDYTYVAWWPICKTSLEGNPLKCWCEFYIGTEIATDQDGYVYVSDNMHIPAVKKYNSAGELLAQWGYQGTGPGEFQLPTGIALDGSGYVYVGDWILNRVQKFRKKETSVQSSSFGKVKALKID
jgi:DNA-binding beta-propeller fold protein YncE